MSSFFQPEEPSANRPTMSRRRLLKTFGLLSLGASVPPLLAGCSQGEVVAPSATPQASGGSVTLAPATAQPASPTPSATMALPSATPQATLNIFYDPAPAANARISYGDDPLQFGDLRLPSGQGPFPVVAMLHGGCWQSSYTLDHTGHLCAALAAAGVATWNIEYRRIGDPGGGWPGTFHDAARAVDHLREIAAAHSLDLARVATMGHSAGGHLALWVAARHRLPAGDPLLTGADPLPLKGAVSLAGINDMAHAADRIICGGAARQLLEGFPHERPERYASASPLALLPLGLPQLLVHGERDTIVPLTFSTTYQRQAQSLGDSVRLVAFPAAGHFPVIDPSSAEWPQVQAAILELLA